MVSTLRIQDCSVDNRSYTCIDDTATRHGQQRIVLFYLQTLIASAAAPNKNRNKLRNQKQCIRRHRTQTIPTYHRPWSHYFNHSEHHSPRRKASSPRISEYLLRPIHDHTSVQISSSADMLCPCSAFQNSHNVPITHIRTTTTRQKGPLIAKSSCFIAWKNG